MSRPYRKHSLGAGSMQDSSDSGTTSNASSVDRLDGSVGAAVGSNGHMLPVYQSIISACTERSKRMVSCEPLPIGKEATCVVVSRVDPKDTFDKIGKTEEIDDFLRQLFSRSGTDNVQQRQKQQQPLARLPFLGSDAPATGTAASALNDAHGQGQSLPTMFTAFDVLDPSTAGVFQLNPAVAHSKPCDVQTPLRAANASEQRNQKSAHRTIQSPLSAEHRGEGDGQKQASTGRDALAQKNASILTTCNQSSPNPEENDGRQDMKDGICEDEKSKPLKFRQYQSDLWDGRYMQLVEYYQRNGHCLVEAKDSKALSHWVKRQRHQYKQKMEGKHSTMTEERQEKLERLGFIWDTHEDAWEQRFRDLLVFRQATGHCNVPTNYDPNPSLGIWVKGQRRQYRLHLDGQKSTITPARIDRLKRVGFVWNIRVRGPPETKKAEASTAAEEYSEAASGRPAKSDDADSVTKAAAVRSETTLSAAATTATMNEMVLGEKVPAVSETGSSCQETFEHDEFAKHLSSLDFADVL